MSRTLRAHSRAVQSDPPASTSRTDRPLAPTDDRQPGDRPSLRDAGPPRPISKWSILALVAAGTFMTTVDGSIVNISLPAIARSFGVPVGGTIEWVIIGYLLVIASVLLTFGRLSDMIGRKPIFAAGLAIFTVGSGVCGAAPSLLLLIAARALQGIGAALIFAPSTALLTDAFPPSERGRAIGLNAVAVALGVSTGPTLGGLLTEYLSWRWIFYVNLPIGALGLWAALRVLPSTRRRPQRFDLPGAVLLGLGLGAITLGLSFGTEWGWVSPRLFASIAVGVLCLVGLVLVERHVTNPIIHFTLLTRREFAAALASLVLSFLAMFAVSFLLPFYFEDLRGFSTVRSGLLLTPMSLTIGVIAPYSGSLADRVGPRWLTSGGLVIACAGLICLSGSGVDSSLPDIIWRLVLTGVGIALFQAPNNRALMAAAPASEQGEASGLLATGRVVGQSLSVALAGAIFGALGGAEAANALVAAQSQGQALAPDQLTLLQQTFVGAFHAALLTSAALAAIGVVTSLVRGEQPSQPPRTGQPGATSPGPAGPNRRATSAESCPADEGRPA